MVVCKYFQQGNCRYGNNCRFEHSKTGNSGSNNNNNSGSNSRPGVFGSRSESERWQLNEDDIRSDLTSQRPKWILSSYGPAKDLPGALLTDNEYSPEEVKWRFYQRRLEIGADAANQEAVQVWQKSDQQMQQIALNAKDVTAFMVEKEKERPNRYNWVKYEGNVSREDFRKRVQYNALPGSSMTPWSGPGERSTITNNNPFSAAGQNTSPFAKTPNSNPFAQSAQSSPFAKPANSTGFGQPTASLFAKPNPPAASSMPAFGQSGFGAAQPAFGQPAAGAQSTTPAFGQTGFGSTTPAFGQPAGGTTFGQTPGSGQTANQNPFGRPNTFGSTTSANGTTFGQPTNNSPFGGTTQTSNTSPFGQTAQSTNQSPFGTAAPNPAFAKPAFGQAGGFGQQTQHQSAPGFGQPAFGSSSQPNDYGQQDSTQQNTSPFAKPNPPAFGQQSSPFGTQQPQQSQPFAAQPAQTQNPFSRPTFGQPQQSQQPNRSPFGSSPFGQQSQTQQPNQPVSGRNAGPSMFRPDTTTGGGFQTNTSGGPAMSGAVPPVSTSKPTDKPVQPLHYSQTLPNIPTTFNGNNPRTFRGQPLEIEQRLRPTLQGDEVVDEEIPAYQRPDRKGLERVWFPLGAGDRRIQNLPSTLLDYHVPDDQMSDADKSAYGGLFTNGRFENHRIPLVPPSRGWIDYDF